MSIRFHTAVAWRGHARLEKYHVDDLTTPYEVIEADNLLLTAGASLVAARLTGGAGTALDATNARVCVGNGTTPVSAAHTDLQGASKFRRVVDAAPIVSGGQMQFAATFPPGEASFDWQEAGLANSAAGAVLVNRFLQNFGVKTAGLQWTLTITATVS